MARTPLFPRAGDFTSWALNITQRIERDYAELKAENDSLSAAFMLDLHSVSVVIKADISSVSAAITTAYLAEDDSVSAVIKADIGSVSAAIKADISSVSAVLETHINSVSATINARLVDRLPVAWANITSVTVAANSTMYGYNVSTVSRSATGIFRVTYTTAINVTKRSTFLGGSDFGVIVTNEAGLLNTSVKFYCYSINGASLVDPGYISFVVYGAS